MRAYLQFGSESGPFQTSEVELKIRDMPHHLSGRSWTASGYGARIPTRLMVKWEGRWRRVYSTCYSNVSTEWVKVRGEKVLVTVTSEWSRP